MRKLDVGDKMIIKRRVGEGVDGFWNVLTAGLNRDIIVVGKVDTCLLLGWIVGDSEQFPFELGVGRAGNVCTVSPLSIS